MACDSKRYAELERCTTPTQRTVASEAYLDSAQELMIPWRVDEAPHNIEDAAAHRAHTKCTPYVIQYAVWTWLTNVLWRRLRWLLICHALLHQRLAMGTPCFLQ